MQPTQSVNGFIRSLPRMVKKKVWKAVELDGTVVQYVSATDNRELTAHRYINEKYPDKVLLLKFSHYKGYIAVSR
jgi:hypothetical protein